MPVSVNTGGCRMQPREDGCPGGIAGGRVAVSVPEQNALPDKPVKVWRLDLERLSFELTRTPIIEIVDGDEENVGVARVG